MINDIPMINQSMIESHFNPTDLIDICRQVFLTANDDGVFSPSKFTMNLPESHDGIPQWICSMPAYLSDQQIAGVKWVSVNSGNASINLPTVSGVIILNCMKTGRPIAFLDASIITQYRTAVSVLLAAEMFAPKEINSMTLVGPGDAGKFIFLFMALRYGIKQVNVISRSENSVSHFKQFLKAHQLSSISVEPVSSMNDVQQHQDAIVLATTANEHILKPEHLGSSDQDQFICGITAFNDISPDILPHIDHIVFDNSSSAKKRINEVSGIDLDTHPVKSCHSMVGQGHSTAHRSTGKHLYLPVGVSAMDIALACYFYKKYNE